MRTQSDCLDTAFNILKAVASIKVCTAVDVAKGINTNKRTAQRYLASLEKHGYVFKIAGDGFGNSNRWFLTEKAKMFGVTV